MEWLSVILPYLIAGGFSVAVAVITSRTTVKSQNRQSELVKREKAAEEAKQKAEREDAEKKSREDRELKWFNELQEERDRLRQERDDMRTVVRAMTDDVRRVKSVAEQMAQGYRRYILTLRRQLVSLGADPDPAPEELEL